MVRINRFITYLLSICLPLGIAYAQIPDVSHTDKVEASEDKSITIPIKKSIFQLEAFINTLSVVEDDLLEEEPAIDYLYSLLEENFQQLFGLRLPDKDSTDPEEVYHVLAIEAAMVDGHYEWAAQKALNFTLHHKVVLSTAKLAISYYYMQGQYEKAFEGIKAVYNSDVKDESVSKLYALLLGLTGREEAFIHTLQDNIRTATRETLSERLLLNASILEELKDAEKALRLFEETSAPFFNSEWQKLSSRSAYHLYYADFAMAANYTDLAWKEAFEAIHLDRQSAEAASRILRLSLGPRRVQGMNFVRDFLHKHPQNRRLYLDYINELSRDGRYTEAIQEIKKMQKNAPEDFELLYFQSLIHFDAQQWVQARQVLTQYISIQQQRVKSLPKESSSADGLLLDARKLMVVILKAEKKYRQALNQLALIPPEEVGVDVIMEKARLLVEVGEIKTALTVLEKAADAFPESRVNFLWLGGNLLNESGRTDQAVVYFNEALKAFPDDIEIKYALAMLYEKRGELWPAEKLLREIIKEDPQMSEGYNALGYIFADHQYNLEEAKELLNQALRLDPNNPYVLDSMGWLHYRLRNYDFALRYLERAFEIEPQATIAAHLADTYMALGNQQRAKEVLKMGLEDDPQDTVLQDTIKRLNLGVK
ncbi:tetratricopeptide repeat protein [Pelistega ratti]|uniref:tetratricopeptide repeat protein n=1 Tax=Pelistega ratti TaxID=2652177 RepID=UPI00135C1AF1|nr:tetratricopeptide repeat protein [Pelistega ratti]